jgi:hypothetical protein
VTLLSVEAREALSVADPTPEARAELAVLSLRWRCLADIFGHDVATSSPLMQKTCRRLCHLADVFKMPRPPALGLGTGEDWTRELLTATEALDALRRTRLAEADRGGPVRALLEALRFIASRAPQPPDPEGLDVIRRGLQALAPFLHLRAELSSLATPFREALAPDFAFLWPGEAQGDDVGVIHLSRRALLERMLRRMLSKTAIGGIHAPREQVLKGFPAHQRGLAADGLAHLVKARVAWEKSTPYGRRVALEPARIATVRGFLEGQPFGVDVLDRWVSTDAHENAA